MTSEDLHATCLDASALVQLYVSEPDSEKLRRYINTQATWYTTTVCFYEALGVFKSKLKNQKRADSLSTDAYLIAGRELVAYFAATSRGLKDLDLTDPLTFSRAQNVFRKYPNLDMADAFQILSVKEGFFSPLCGESRTVLVTADNDLANAAEKEGLRVLRVSELPQI